MRVTGTRADACVRREVATALCAGHFPADPLVPGAYLAGMMAALAERLTGRAPRRLVRCTFVRPVRPDRPIEVVARRAAGTGLVDVEVRVDGVRAARGVIAVGDPA